jgi:hypothetical protein
MNWGSHGLQFVNSDVTMLLAREPEGTMIGLAARDRQEAGGVSVATAVMFDCVGPIGLTTVTSHPRCGWRSPTIGRLAPDGWVGRLTQVGESWRR